MKGGPIDLSEVQDFSISKKSGSGASSFGLGFPSGKGKLDDMLTKLMKKNNYVSAFRFHCSLIPNSPSMDETNIVLFVVNSQHKSRIHHRVQKKNARESLMRSCLVYRLQRKPKRSQIHLHLLRQRRHKFHPRFLLHQPVDQWHQTVNRHLHKNHSVLRLLVFQAQVQVSKDNCVHRNEIFFKSLPLIN